MLPAGGATAQTDANRPAGMKIEQGTAPAPKAQSTPMKTASADMKGPSRRDEDARHCLALASTAEIVKCAEPYRY
jgi:hypothetical protein